MKFSKDIQGLRGKFLNLLYDIMKYISVTVFIISIFIIYIFLHNKSPHNDIVWNKKDVIPQSFFEDTDEVDYILYNASFKFFIRRNDFISDVVREKHY